MTADTLPAPPVTLISVKKHTDPRGFFSETYKTSRLEAAGVGITFVQDNHAFSVEKNTIRGIHFQTPPFAQDKLVRVVRGAILDVAVDLRVGSPTFRHHVSAVISADNWQQILVPIGFGHGLVTLEPDTEVLYKVSNLYSPEHDKGVLWNDPDLDIDWGIDPAGALLSDKDKAQPHLKDLPAYFTYDPGRDRPLSLETID
ncbi:MAG: dTDP-4-dehydrorhamnose 3,5-epimerase [Roseibium sp.]|nr:dTDP-4-dehydrorhamnose 3,5-epimerase [Roseibium sp.]